VAYRFSDGQTASLTATAEYRYICAHYFANVVYLMKTVKHRSREHDWLHHNKYILTNKYACTEYELSKNRGGEGTGAA